MDLSGKKVAILAADLYEDMELWAPYYRLQEAGAEVTIVGTEATTYESKHGYPVKADLAAKDAKLSQFDGVVIPGGFAPDYMRRDEAMVGLVRDMVNAGKTVAAICHGGWMLCSAEVIKGKTVTGFFAIRDDLVHAGADYVDREVVRDGNLITSRNPGDLPAFNREVVKALAGRK